MSNPIDEFLEMKKQAFGEGFGGYAKRIGGVVGPSMATGGAMALGTLGVAGLAGGASKVYGAITKKRDFDAMMEANPHLNPIQEGDPEGFNRLFTSIRSMAPEFTADPLIAGTLMHDGMEFGPEQRGHIALKALRERMGSRQSPGGEALMSGFKSGVGMGKMMMPKDPKMQRGGGGPPQQDLV